MCVLLSCVYLILSGFKSQKGLQMFVLTVVTSGGKMSLEMETKNYGLFVHQQMLVLSVCVFVVSVKTLCVRIDIAERATSFLDGGS